MIETDAKTFSGRIAKGVESGKLLRTLQSSSRISEIYVFKQKSAYFLYAEVRERGILYMSYAINEHF